MASSTLGGIQEVDLTAENAREFDELGHFAVEEHKKHANALMEFEKIVSVRKQVVEGTLYHLSLDVRQGEGLRCYRAKVLVKPWLDQKELQRFGPVNMLTSSDCCHTIDNCSRPSLFSRIFNCKCFSR